MITINLSEIKPGADITIAASIKDNKGKIIEFRSKVIAVIGPEIAVGELLNEDGKPVSFISDKLYIEVMSLNGNKQPVIWENVEIVHYTYETIPCHKIKQTTEGKVNNRRNNYRLSLSGEASVILPEGNSIRVTMRDVSISGFAFVYGDVIDLGTSVQLICPMDEYNLDLKGKIRRSQKIGKQYVYGCKSTTIDKGLDKFITQKQRELAKKGIGRR